MNFYKFFIRTSPQFEAIIRIELKFIFNLKQSLMSSLELSILKVEGLEAGTFCRVLLDNEELLIKNSIKKKTVKLAVVA